MLLISHWQLVNVKSHQLLPSQYKRTDYSSKLIPQKSIADFDTKTGLLLECFQNKTLHRGA